MHWQLHLSSQPLRTVNILPKDSHDIIAVSNSRDRIRFYGLSDGAHYGDLLVDLDLLDNDSPEERRAKLAELKAPNGAFLRFLEFNDSELYVSMDGGLRLIHDLQAGITLEIEDQVIPLNLPGNGSVISTALDREMGTIVALTEDNIVYVYQQQSLISTLPQEEERILKVEIVNGGSQILLVQPSTLRLIDTAGKTVRSHDIHYSIGPIAISPNGNWVAASDTDHQVIRLYNRDIIPVRQQHAVDLVAKAQQLQLFASVPAAAAPLAALDISDSGALAFAMAGILCASHVDRLSDLPQPRLMF